MERIDKCGGCMYENACDYITCRKEEVTKIRNKAIDEFAERLKTDYIHYDMYYIFENNGVMFEKASIKSYKDMIDEMAEQLKNSD